MKNITIRLVTSLIGKKETPRLAYSLSCIYLILFGLVNSISAQTISTFAGTGSIGFSGDGGPASAAELNISVAGGVMADKSGNIYIADRINHRIRKVDTNGIITTIAGNGIAGFSGDGGPATAAQLCEPTDLVMDGAGNLFIADVNNQRIRKVDPSGTITTVAGSGPVCDRFAASYAGDGGPATAARLGQPAGVEVDSAGNLYISEFQNHRIRRVDAITGIITTVAGTGAATYNGDGIPAIDASLNFPVFLVIDSEDNLFITDSRNHRIRKLDALTGMITTVAGTGVAGFNGDGIIATSAHLNRPLGLALDTAGHLFIAERNGHRVRRVDAVTGQITTVAGTGSPGFSGHGGPATAAQLNQPTDAALDGAGNLYIAERLNNRVRKVGDVGAIDDVPPTITILSPASGFIEAVDNEIVFSAEIEEVYGLQDAVWVIRNFDELETEVSASFVQVSGDLSKFIVEDTFTFASAGIYTISLEATDTFGNQSESTVVTDQFGEELPAFIVIYDPEGESVTGGGWIWSPEGAFHPELAEFAGVTGKATFGFIAKYKKGAHIPSGNTEFHFKAGDLKFSSTEYEWLVVAGKRAQYKGQGTINGDGGFRFMLTAIDGDLPGGDGTDRLRMKIWDDEAGIIYDNQHGTVDESGLDEATILGGGNIKIHKAK